MSRRLSQMSEESLEEGGSSARKAVEEAGFDENLKRRLEERIAGANFKNEYANILAQVELPSSADKMTKAIAGAKAWDGNESVCLPQCPLFTLMINAAHRLKMLL